MSFGLSASNSILLLMTNEKKMKHGVGFVYRYLPGNPVYHAFKEHEWCSRNTMGRKGVNTYFTIKLMWPLFSPSMYYCQRVSIFYHIQICQSAIMPMFLIISEHKPYLFHINYIWEFYMWPNLLKPHARSDSIYSLKWNNAGSYLREDIISDTESQIALATRAGCVCLSGNVCASMRECGSSLK